MKRSLLNQGTKDEILHELNRYGSDRAQAGKEDRAREYARAVNAIQEGAEQVEVEHAIYRVVEVSPSPGELSDTNGAVAAG